MDDGARLVVVALATLSYAALCGGISHREKRRATVEAADAATLAGGDAPVLVVHATQTGQAEAIAWQTARGLHASGTAARVMSLNELDLATLKSATRALFVASTYGEGDAPDGATAFVESSMEAPAELGTLRYAVLALGDRQYDHFCGFGRRLDAWLRSSGALPVTDRIDVDNSDEAALAAWQKQWHSDKVADAGEDDDGSAFQPWRLIARHELNPGSSGAPIFHLAFQPPSGTSQRWESGDLSQISLASDPSRPRDYSIASIPADVELQLLVRQERHVDGSLGAASGLLTSSLALGDTIALRVRAHSNFRLGANLRRPLILVGNGTGMAGLRAHLRERVARGERENWLLFGERSVEHDFIYREELERWRTEGFLPRLDMVFSRDEEAQHGERRYVQHRLLQNADALADWFARDAAIYVCGSLKGMASGVDGALRQVLGETRVREISAAGRYRRDVY